MGGITLKFRNETVRLRNVTFLIDIQNIRLYNETTISVDTECSFIFLGRSKALDKTDELILDLLKGNARMSYEELGQAIGMSRVAAKKRVAKLEKEGIIRGYNTCIYREGEVTLYIELVTKPDKFEDVLKFLANRTAFIRQIFKTSKENHIQIVAVSTDVEGLNYLLNTIRKVCDKDITELHFHTVKDVIKDVYGGIDKYNERKSVSVDSGSDGTIAGCDLEKEARGQVQIYDVPDEGKV